MPRRRRAVLGRPGRPGHRRLPPAPVPRPRGSTRLGMPGFAFSDGPRGVVVGNATCFPVTMARGATWDLDLEERIGEAIGRELRAVGRRPLRRRVRERAAPPGVGPGAGDLRRGSAPRRRAGRRAHPRRAAPRDGMREALRLQLDGERPLHGRHQVDEVALHEVYLPALPAHRRRGRGVRDERLQRGQRRVVRRRAAPLLTDVLRDEWGFEGFVISDWIFGLRDAGHVGARPASTSRCPYRMVRATAPRDALRAGEVDVGRHRRARRRTIVADAAALRRRPAATAARRVDVLGAAGAPGAGTRGRRQGRSCCCATSRSTARRCCPLDAGALRRVAVLGRLADERQPRRRRVERRVGTRLSSPLLDGLRAALPGAEVVHDDGADLDGAAASRPTPTSRSSSSATPTSTRASTSATAGTAHLRRAPSRRPTSPSVVGRLRGARSPTTRCRDAGPRPRQRRARASPPAATASSLRLHDDDEALIRAVAAANPRTVVAIVAGSAVLTEEWRDEVPARRAGLVRRAWRAATALADVLLGARRRHRPPAVLACPPTRPTCRRSTATPTRSPTTAGTASGTSPATGTSPPSRSASASRTRRGSSGPTTRRRRRRRRSSVRAQLRNTGDRDGADVVQVYAGRPADTPGRPAASWASPASRSPPGERRGRAAHAVVAARASGIADPRWVARPGHLRAHGRPPQRRPQRRRPRHRPSDPAT